MTLDITDRELRAIKRMAKRNIYRNLDALDHKLDRVIKGTGDIIGGILAAGGALMMVVGAACADSVPTESLNTLSAVMIFGLISLTVGVKILNWMRS